jgi:hypothetical protein
MTGIYCYVCQNKPIHGPHGNQSNGKITPYAPWLKSIGFLYMSILTIIMDLLVKSAIAVVVVVVIVGAAFYLQSSGVFTQQVTQAQAVSLVYHDLQNSNPTANINITNVTPSQYSGSWHIMVSIIENATSPCPSYFVYSFDYPKYGFVYQIYNTYTDNCVIYGNKGNQTIIGSAPAAITRSYDLNIPAVVSFIQKYGYSSVKTYAAYYKNFVSTGGYNYTGVWLVNYITSKSNATVSVLIYQNNGTAVTP